MSKKTTKSTSLKKSNPQPSRPETRENRAASSDKRRMLILFGVDENKKPRAARFVEEELGLLAKAADAMDLIMCDVKTPKLSELALKLPAGRLHAGGAGFVPYVRQDLYDKLVEAVGSDGSAPTEPPTAVNAPHTFEEIAPGHLVIAQEDLEYGWWEAIVFACDGDILTLRYRDYPRLPKFTRHRTAVALLYHARWPLRKKERVWLDVLLYTGLRRGDAVRAWQTARSKR